MNAPIHTVATTSQAAPGRRRIHSGRAGSRNILRQMESSFPEKTCSVTELVYISIIEDMLVSVEISDVPAAGPDTGSLRSPQPGDAWSLTDVITRLRRVLRSSVRHEFPWESLPMAQVEILQRLADEPDLGVSELAARQRLATNTVSSLAQQMVTSGLITRRPRPGDRRAVSLRLTATGTEMLASWQQANERRLGQALERLPLDQQKTVEGAVPALAALAGLLENDERNEIVRLIKDSEASA